MKEFFAWLDTQLLAAYIGGASDANDGVKCKRETFAAWKARYADQIEQEAPEAWKARRAAEARAERAAEAAVEDGLPSIKTRDLLREIIETERDRDVTGGFRHPDLAERVDRLYAEIDARLPPRKVT